METETEATPVVSVAVDNQRWRIKPGWYVLAVLFLYSLVSTFLLLRPRETVMGQGSTPELTSLAPEGLWFPIPGAKIPQEDRFLPTADRPYRKGINQGFVFNTDGTGIPINYGTPVIAAGDGTIVRADLEYKEMSSSEWRQLLDKVGVSGATDAQLDKLRGRQIWLRLEDGRLLRYGHLSNIKQGIDKGVRVYRGQVIGYVGNSGTDDGVSKTTGGARLQFEVWPTDNTFFGQNIESMDRVRISAASLFVGP
jgi:murein DD-endopeptidase MepM/ murein hydrolase activator NlpD